MKIIKNTLKILLFLPLLYVNISHGDYAESCKKYTDYFSSSSTDDSTFNYIYDTSKYSTGAKLEYQKMLEERTKALLSQKSEILPLLNTSDIQAGCSSILDLSDENSIINADEDKRTKLVLCAGGVILKSNPKAFETEDDLYDAGKDDNTTALTDCVSSYERLFLEYKKKILEKNLQTTLGFGDNGKLLELKSGLDCGGKKTANSKILFCISDSRKQKMSYVLKISGFMSDTRVMLNMMWTNVVNSSLIGLNFITSTSAVGYINIDSLPIFPYSFKDIFNKNTIYGFVNMFIMPIYPIIILWYAFRKGISFSDEGEDSYKTFFIKFIIIICFTIGFGLFYTGIKYVLDTFSDSMSLSIKTTITNDPKMLYASADTASKALKFEIFSSDGGAVVSGWSLITTLPNIIILFCLSLFYFLRDLFLNFLSLIFSFTAVGLLVGSTKQSAPNKLIGRGGRWLAKMMYWAISVYICTIIMVMLIKFMTMVLFVVPSFDDPSIGFIDSLPMLGISCFIYLILVSIIIWQTAKRLLSETTDFIAKIFQKLFFDGEEYGGLKSIVNDFASAYKEVKMTAGEAITNNRYIAPVTDFIKNTETYRDLDDFLNNENSPVRRTLDSKWGYAAKRAVGAGVSTMGKLAFGIEDLSNEKQTLKNGLLHTLGVNTRDEETQFLKKSTFLDSEIQKHQELFKNSTGYEKSKHEVYLNSLKNKRFSLYKKYELPRQKHEMDEIITKLNNTSDLKEREELLSKYDTIKQSMDPFIEHYKENDYNPYVAPLVEKITSLDIEKLGEEGYAFARNNLDYYKDKKYEEILGGLNFIEAEKFHHQLKNLKDQSLNLEEEISVEKDSKHKLDLKNKLKDVKKDIDNLSNKRNNILEEMSVFGYDVEDYKKQREIEVQDISKDGDISNYDANNEEEVNQKIDDVINSGVLNNSSQEVEQEEESFDFNKALNELKSLNGKFLTLGMDAGKVIQSSNEQKIEPKILDKIKNIHETLNGRRTEIFETINAIAATSKNKKEFEENYLNNDYEKNYIKDLIEDNNNYYTELIESYSDQEEDNKKLEEPDQINQTDEAFIPNKNLEQINAGNFEQKVKAFWAED